MELDELTTLLESIEKDLKESIDIRDRVAADIKKDASSKLFGIYQNAKSKIVLLLEEKKKVQSQIFEAKREALKTKKKEAGFFKKGAVIIELKELELEEQNAELENLEIESANIQQDIAVSEVGDAFYTAEITRINEESKGSAPSQETADKIFEAMKKATDFRAQKHGLETEAVFSNAEAVANAQEKKKKTESALSVSHKVEGFISGVKGFVRKTNEAVKSEGVLNGFKDLVEKTTEIVKDKYEKVHSVIERKGGERLAQKNAEQIRELRAKIAKFQQEKTHLTPQVDALQTELDQIIAQINAGGTTGLMEQLSQKTSEKVSLENRIKSIDGTITTLKFQVQELGGDYLPEEDMTQEKPEAVVEAPEVEENAQEKPEAPAVEENVVEAPEAPAVEEVVQEKPEAPEVEENVVEAPEAPVVEEVVQEKPEAPAVEESVVEAPEAPVVEEVVQEKPEAPAVEENVVEAPEAPVVEEVVQEKPEAPAVEENVVESPEAPVVEETVVEPSAVEQATQDNVVENRQTQVQEEIDITTYMAAYAKKYEEYYADNKGTRGNAHTKEELAGQRKLNTAMRKYISKKIEGLATENEVQDSAVVAQLTDPISSLDLQELMSNQNAVIKLFQIASSGVYENDGQRIRLTRKQKVALSSVLVKVSEKKADLESKKLQEVDMSKENAARQELGEG